MTHKSKVLIIDDNEELANLLKLNLEKTKRYRVYTANSGRKGIQVVQKKRPDVVVLDIMMPDMDGLEVLEQIKGEVKTYEIPVIMLTGMSNPDSWEKARENYAGEYLVKPVSVERLMNTIDRVMIFG